METACNNTCSSCEKFNDNCGCGFEDDEIDVFPSNPMLAQSYVPIQYMDETFKPCTGLENGTIFPELVSPYAPCDSMRDIAFIEKTNKIGEGCNSCQ
ncbi:MAG: spore coat associated protein CotJA [Clostridia bacterium]|nr:spore coat associated protein CotJA [Clostridia bacterium]